MIGRLVIWVLLGLILTGFVMRQDNKASVDEARALSLRQFENDNAVPAAIRKEYSSRNMVYGLGVLSWGLCGLFLMYPEIVKTGMWLKENEGN